jgi:perosamine synthetase
VDTYNSVRRRHAEALRCGIDGIEGLEIPRALAGANPVYQRFPILARDAAHRADLLARLRAAGVLASSSYPAALADVPGVGRYLAPDQEPCPGARSIATRIITLPSHPGVTLEDAERMVRAVRGRA